MTPFRGILLKISAVVLFVLMQTCIKAVSGDVPAGETVFFRSLFALPVIIGWLAVRGELARGVRVVSVKMHLLRGIVGTAAMGMGFAALGLLPLPEVTAIGYAMPLLTVVFAALILKEQVRLFRFAAVGLGLVGVLIVLWPRLVGSGASLGEGAALGALLVLGSASLAALAQITIRRMVATETTSSIVFWFSITATLASLLTLPFGWVVPAGWQMGLLVLSGILGGVGQILLTSSYRHADASLLAPFDYTSMLLALGIGYFVFAEVPTPMMLTGAALIITAGVLIIWRERQLGLKRGRARPNMTPQG
ncbi:DMT family transporter [Pseudoruegeria sp. SHC-113]|uniref:DMT family transporter n=1 Tax=Pseudoruegeria sp. SHC-113 TaxID=2855439 RepID=UPI0021BBAFD8|nr:DMT family transporter [Pseudoruegeria sp. SHC-113]MCT8158710.1 DMT family transporter [Pseudoruegeria sp. SHC-113]